MTPRSRWAPYLEILVLVGALALVNLIVWPKDPGLTAFRPHPMLFITLLVVARYGFTAGVVAGVACAAEYAIMFLALSHRPAYELLSGGRAAPLIVLVPSTVFLGMLVQHHIDRRKKAEADAARARAQIDEVQAGMSVLRDINLELGARIVNAQSTRLLLINQLRQLATVERARLEPAFVRVLTEVLRAESVSVWRVSGLKVELAASMGPPAAPLPNDVERHFGDGDVLAAHDVAEGRHLPLLLGRVRSGDSGSVAAFVCVDGLSLQETPEARELFTALVNWFTTSMGQAAAFERQGTAAKRGAG